MKALTLWRPWDQAILYGGKCFENRPWSLWRSMIGERIALHAGKKYDIDGANWMREEGFYVPPPVTGSPMGITGVVVFDRVIHEREAPEDPWFMGPFGWHIGEKHALDEPIPCAGQQGLWNVPDEILERIMNNVRT